MPAPELGNEAFCEYCRLHEADADFLAFHVEHIVAKQHGGADDPETFCYACCECNWAKGPNLSGLLGDKIYRLFIHEGRAGIVISNTSLRYGGIRVAARAAASIAIAARAAP